VDHQNLARSYGCDRTGFGSPTLHLEAKLLNFYLLVEGTAMSGEGLLSSLVFSYKNQFDQLVKGLYILQLQARVSPNVPNFLCNIGLISVIA
jgi:hypothetical protein